MAKPTGGLLAFNARGSIAKTIVFASWRGRQYVRQHVIPANPRTVSQTSTRNVFTWLVNAYKVFPAVLTEPWFRAAQGNAVTDRNLYIKANLRNLLSQTDISLLTSSSGAKGGFANSSVLYTTPLAGQITITWDTPVLPTGWTFAAEIMGVLPDQNPHMPFTGEWVTNVGMSPTANFDFTGLAAGDYFATAFPKYTKPDGSTAYGPAINGFVTVT